MEYKVNELAKLAGVSGRTLRYYDQIGLLRPRRSGTGEWRVYGPAQVDRLQQILFYRRLGLGPKQIGDILDDPGFDGEAALRQHLNALLQQKAQLNALIDTVRRTIAAQKGEITMQDKEKFEGFKARLIQENEQAYGAEIRAAYGDEAVDESNARLMNATQAQYSEFEALTGQVNAALARAVADGDAKGEAAREACRLHQQWIRQSWGPARYSAGAHLGLCQMYVQDERFTAYYEQVAPGAAEFLLKAMQLYLQG